MQWMLTLHLPDIIAATMRQTPGALPNDN